MASDAMVSDPHAGHAILHDFCMVIPYGITMALAGIVALCFKVICWPVQNKHQSTVQSLRHDPGATESIRQGMCCSKMSTLMCVCSQQGFSTGATLLGAGVLAELLAVLSLKSWQQHKGSQLFTAATAGVCASLRWPCICRRS